MRKTRKERHGGGILRLGTTVGVDIVKHGRDVRESCHPELRDKRPILVDDNKTRAVIRLKLLKNKGLVRIMRYETRFQDKNTNPQ